MSTVASCRNVQFCDPDIAPSFPSSTPPPAQLWYLWKYEPTLLFPKKDPKKKLLKWRRSKFKQRGGKLNQDGKGGRSNNTT